MKTLVTGAGGFIGAHLVERLLADGHDVRALDNFSTGRRENLLGVADDIELVEGDIQSYERVHTAVRDCDLVFHQAALPSVPRSVQDPLTSHGVNVVGTLNVLLASRDAGVRRVVFASSSSVYGRGAELPKREDMPAEPISPYAVAKLAAENFCRSFSEVYELETVALRYFNVFGPRQDPLSQYSAVIPKFITALLDGDSPHIHGDGGTTRDFTYIDNVIDANLLAAEAPGVSGRRYNVAVGGRTSLNDLVAEMQALVGTDVEPTHGPSRPGDVPHSCADISAAMTDLGYEPRVDLREGLARTLPFYEAQMRPTRAPVAG